MRDADILAVAEAFNRRFPMLDPVKTVELAAIARDVLDQPEIIGSGLPVCRICRAPRREARK